jgi:hypothetical protein
MDVGIPNSLGSAYRIALWAAAPFVFFMAAIVEGFIAGNYLVAGMCAVLFVLSVPTIVVWDRIFSLHWRRHVAFILITVGAVCLAAGIYLLAAQQKPMDDHIVANPAQSSAPVAPAKGSPIFNAGITFDNDGVTYLRFRGEFSRGGKNLKYVIECAFDTMGRGPASGNYARVRIGESKDFVRGEKISIPIASYLNAERSAAKWGPDNAPVGGSIENGTFQFTWFVRATLIAIDENDDESKIFSFLLLPKHSAGDYLNSRYQGPGRQPLPPPTGENLLLYPEGALRALDPVQ